MMTKTNKNVTLTIKYLENPILLKIWYWITIIHPLYIL